MKNLFLLTIALLFTTLTANAQSPLQISGADCNGVSHDMFSELDAGKAVVVFFFMPSCSSCPPPAQKVQRMVNKIMLTHPNMVTGYTMPFNNTTTCAATSSWVTSSSVPFYAPYSRGATQVANYGGFGMPTVVLLGGAGANRRVMFSTQSFANADTTIMRDSILALLARPVGVNEVATNITALNVYPNPADATANITMELTETAALKIDVIDMVGREVAILVDEKNVSGLFKKDFSTASWSSGLYTVRINANGQITKQKLNVVH